MLPLQMLGVLGPQSKLARQQPSAPCTLPNLPSPGKRTHRMSGGIGRVWHTWPWLLFRSSLHSSYAPTSDSSKDPLSQLCQHVDLVEVLTIYGTHSHYEWWVTDVCVQDPFVTHVPAQQGPEHTDSSDGGLPNENWNPNSLDILYLQATIHAVNLWIQTRIQSVIHFWKNSAFPKVQNQCFQWELK